MKVEPAVICRQPFDSAFFARPYRSTDSIKKLFSPFAAWCKLNELIEVRFKLKIDIEDKREAEDIDSDQLALDKNCSSITYKVDPLRVPRNACTYNGWLENCKELKLLSDKELKESFGVRESLFVAREKTKNLLHAQQEKTEHTIRRRIFETQRQRNELQWQKNKVGQLDAKKARNIFVTRWPLNCLSISHFICLLSPHSPSDARRIGKSCPRDLRFARNSESQGQCTETG